MSYLSYIIANVINVLSILGNGIICCYAIDKVKSNHSILYDLNVSSSCKTIYSYNIAYTVLSGLYVLLMSSKLVCSICNTRSTVHWKGSYIIVMSGVSLWGYRLYNKVNEPDYCDGIYDNRYLELRNLMEYQLLSFVIIHGLFVVGKILICMLRRCDAKAKKTESLKLKTSSSGTKFTM